MTVTYNSLAILPMIMLRLYLTASYILIIPLTDCLHGYPRFPQNTRNTKKHTSSVRHNQESIGRSYPERIPRGCKTGVHLEISFWGGLKNTLMQKNSTTRSSHVSMSF